MPGIERPAGTFEELDDFIETTMTVDILFQPAAVLLQFPHTDPDLSYPVNSARPYRLFSVPVSGAAWRILLVCCYHLFFGESGIIKA